MTSDGEAARAVTHPSLATQAGWLRSPEQLVETQISARRGGELGSHMYVRERHCSSHSLLRHTWCGGPGLQNVSEEVGMGQALSLQAEQNVAACLLSEFSQEYKTAVKVLRLLYIARVV